MARSRSANLPPPCSRHTALVWQFNNQIRPVSRPFSGITKLITDNARLAALVLVRPMIVTIQPQRWLMPVNQIHAVSLKIGRDYVFFYLPMTKFAPRWEMGDDNRFVMI